MPMILRSRRSIRPQNDADSLDEVQPASRRRSTRPPPRVTYEEASESDSESVQSLEMETQQQQRLSAELEEETAEETPVTDLKFCSVVLDRLQVDEKAARKELEEKDDMNRKAGKPVSRIPTFHKRPSGATAEPPKKELAKEPTVQVALPAVKAAISSVEASKSKPPDVTDTALPLPSLRGPKVGLDASSDQTSASAAASSSARGSFIAAPKNWSLSESVLSSMMVSPRPALRPEQWPKQLAPQPGDSNTFEPEGHAAQEAPEDTADTAADKHDAAARSSIVPSASGDGDFLLRAERDEAIMDEQPPWELKLNETPEFRDSRSASEDEEEEQEEEVHQEEEEEEEVTEHQEPPEEQTTEVPDLREEKPMFSAAAAPEKPAESPSAGPVGSSGRSGFAVYFLLPLTLLLLGGFGQHVWHYGLPNSVAQLGAQLELHALEGFGFITEPCSTDCRVKLVESIPEGLHPSSSFSSISDSWLQLLDEAERSIQIAAFYVTLRDAEGHASDSQGRAVFERLQRLRSKGVSLQMAVNAPQTSPPDTAELGAAGAEVRDVNLGAVTGGIVHTKLWVVDQKHVYLGSANMDWRSLSQVKEVGVSMENCSCLAQDAARIFSVYWSLGSSNASLPVYWPARLSALSSSQNPLRLTFNGVPARVYLSSAPPQISARGRTDDLNAILSVINDAQKFIYVSVMDYLPLSQFTEPLRFWPDIDSALRAAACTRGVSVRLLVSCWDHSPASMFPFLQSLLVLSRPPLKCDVDVRVYTVPSTEEQSRIPFARVNHAKFMVTDRVVYIGTSNWSQNYFTQTAGVGLVVNQTGSQVHQDQETLQSQAQDLFLRDWGSEFTAALSPDDLHVCPRHRHPH